MSDSPSGWTPPQVSGSLATSSGSMHATEPLAKLTKHEHEHVPAMPCLPEGPESEKAVDTSSSAGSSDDTEAADAQPGKEDGGPTSTTSPSILRPATLPDGAEAPSSAERRNQECLDITKEELANFTPSRTGGVSTGNGSAGIEEQVQKGAAEIWTAGIFLTANQRLRARTGTFFLGRSRRRVRSSFCNRRQLSTLMRVLLVLLFLWLSLDPTAPCLDNESLDADNFKPTPNRQSTLEN